MRVGITTRIEHTCSELVLTMNLDMTKRGVGHTITSYYTHFIVIT